MDALDILPRLEEYKLLYKKYPKCVTIPAQLAKHAKLVLEVKFAPMEGNIMQGCGYAKLVSGCYPGMEVKYKEVKNFVIE